MQQQVASFLFQHQSCPLPGIGTLYLRRAGAAGDFTNKTIAAPKPYIEFTDTFTEPSTFINYLAETNGRSNADMTAALDHFCTGLKNEMAAAQQVNLPAVGVFYTDSSGKLHFTEESLPAALIQPVFAERVIHPNEEHSILVGDKESTNTLMTEMLAPKAVTRESWWIWTMVLALVAITIILLYFTMSNNASSLGNAVKI